jgi:hypothetical protein
MPAANGRDGPLNDSAGSILGWNAKSAGTASILAAPAGRGRGKGIN